MRGRRAVSRPPARAGGNAVGTEGGKSSESRGPPWGARARGPSERHPAGHREHRGVEGWLCPDSPAFLVLSAGSEHTRTGDPTELALGSSEGQFRLSCKRGPEHAPIWHLPWPAQETSPRAGKYGRRWRLLLCRGDRRRKVRYTAPNEMLGGFIVLSEPLLINFPDTQ